MVMLSAGRCKKNMWNKRLIIAALAALFIVKAGSSFNRFVNYTASNCINAIAVDNGNLMVGTTGGLYSYNRSSGTGTLYSDPTFFPDPDITSLCLDGNQTLWQGTLKGYVYKRPRSDRQSVISSYFMSGWSINALGSIGKYLIVGADKGCSIFDTERLVATKNATNFGSAIPNPQVNAIAVFRDTLLLGLERGIGKLHLGSRTLADTNFFDPSIWIIDTTDPSPVKSFAVQENGYRALRIVGAVFKNQIISSQPTSSDDTARGEVFADGVSALTLPSIVTTITSDGTHECFIGTKTDYFFIWDGTTSRNCTIAGPSFTKADRVFVDHDGAAWVCPEIVSRSAMNPWWEGISVFRNRLWQIYSPAQYPTMGPMNGNKDFRGVAEDRYGHMWFGTPGGHLKRYDRSSDSWQKYCVYAQDFGGGKFLQALVCPPGNFDWGKCDAVASDSTGFLWIADWNNFLGSLICYDPRYMPDPSAQDPVSAHYRHFWPTDDPNHSLNIGLLCVDVANNIIAGSDDGKIIVFSHNGTPLRDGITIKHVYQNMGIALDAVSTPDTLTRIVTSTGLYTYDPLLDSLKGGVCVRYRKPDMDTVIDGTLKEIQAVEAENEQILWFGSGSKGLIRYDIANKSSMIIDQTQGLLSNYIQDLSLDKKNGYLWVASDRGVSRYSIGYPVGEQKNAGTPSVYPNPFSKRRHQEIVFEKLPAKSRVVIYSVGGSFVAALSPQDSSSSGAVCAWKPAQAIVPGIYLYTVRSGSGAKNTQGKFIVTP
jgi:ligand-binding sensor domain-containing protein